MRLEVGDIIGTNYDTGPYQIIDIERGCTCQEYVRSLDGDETPSTPHMHLTVKGLIDHHAGKTYWLNGYDENTLQNVWRPSDRIFSAEYRGRKLPVQMTMF